MSAAPTMLSFHCSQCNYDLAHRLVGELCPECGTRIDSIGPRWWDSRCLARISRFALLASIPCYALLLVPALFLVEFGYWFPLGWRGMPTLFVFFVLLPMQVCAQAIATWKLGINEVGEARKRLLRVFALIRLSIFVCAVLTIVLHYNFVLSSQTITNLMGVGIEAFFLLPYFLLPLGAVICDIVVSRVLLSLQRESMVKMSVWQTVAGRISRVALFGVYPLILIPIYGWFLAPIIWTLAMGGCFGELWVVARAAQRSSSANTA